MQTQTRKAVGILIMEEHIISMFKEIKEVPKVCLGNMRLSKLRADLKKKQTVFLEMKNIKIDIRNLMDKAKHEMRHR